MTGAPVYGVNQASAAQLLTHLHACDADFSPALSTRVHMGRYAEKISQNAVRFEAWAAGELVGLVAMYCNDHSTGVAFITHVSVLPTWHGQGIASLLIAQSIQYAWASGMKRIKLSVHRGNGPALALYRKLGFAEEGSETSDTEIRLCLNQATHHD
jgi:ribosomal protein S18 acetylase RimI-like enzyme